MITTLQLFKREKSVVSRERHQGLYTAHEYLLAKVVAELPVTIGVASVRLMMVISYRRLLMNVFV